MIEHCFNDDSFLSNTREEYSGCLCRHVWVFPLKSALVRTSISTERTSFVTTALHSADGTYPNAAREDGPVNSGCRLAMLLTLIVFCCHLALILLCPISVGLNGSLTVFMVCCTCSGPFFFRCFALILLYFISLRLVG
jgi:hypothetical protein